LKALSLYGPVQKEMPRVEESIQTIARVEFPLLALILGEILKHTGKRIRPAITLLAGKFNNYDLDLLVPMATAVEVLHTATLIHDDMIDNSLLRRGNPTLNSVWDNGTTVLVGDYLFANSAELVSTTGNVRVMRLFAQTLMTICNGELRQIFSSGNWRETREDYYRRIARKTAGLFSMATESGAVLGGAPEEQVQALKNYGYNLGMAFQVVDDNLDFMGDEAKMGKPVGSDLLQGTLTLPAILFLEHYPENNPIRRSWENGHEEESLREAIAQIRNSSIIEDSFSTAKDFCNRAMEALRILPNNACRRSLMELTEYVLERKN